MSASSRMHPVAKNILRWYGRHRRDLPWRATRDPYAVWVSEIMLQQTRVETVLPYYQRFLARFPHVQALASASLNEVLKVWENLGYYARAHHLHAAARKIAGERQGMLPATKEELLLLPGIGPYTAAAIASIAHGEAVPAVDGNVKRILCRVFALKTPLDRSSTQKTIRALAEELMPRTAPGRFNQGLMDLGATLCTPEKPSCAPCPLKGLCLAEIQGMQETLPVPRRQRVIPHREMIVPVVFDTRGRILIVQRRSEGLLAGLWGFPSAEKQQHDTVGQALRRALKAHLEIRVTRIEAPVSVKHAYTHFKILARAYPCSSAASRSIRQRSLKWAGPEALLQLPFAAVDRKIMQALSLTTGRR